MLQRTFSYVCEAAAFSFRLYFLFLGVEGRKKRDENGSEKWQPGKIQLQLRIRMVKRAVCGCSIACDVYNGFLFDWKNR
jgi:hypothetical protein